MHSSYIADGVEIEHNGVQLMVRGHRVGGAWRVGSMEWEECGIMEQSGINMTEFNMVRLTMTRLRLLMAAVVWHTYYGGGSTQIVEGHSKVEHSRVLTLINEMFPFRSLNC